MGCREGGELGEGGAGDAHGGPLGHRESAEGVVEVDGWGVPVEDGPLEAGAAFGCGDGGDGGEEGFADALAAELGADEEVFEIDAGVASPGGVVVEVEGEAERSCRLQVVRCRLFGDEAVEAHWIGEAVAE